MEVIEEMHFDDNWAAPEGESWYVGIDRRIAHEGDRFFVQSYDDNPSTAIIMEPENALESKSSRILVEFLATEYGYDRFEFPSTETGVFEEVDPVTMAFKPFR